MRQSRRLSSPFGDLNCIEGIEPGKLIYIYEYDWEEEDWKPPSSWFCLTALGGRMYFKYQKREKAQAACDNFFGKGRYTVISDKRASIR